MRRIRDEFRNRLHFQMKCFPTILCMVLFVSADAKKIKIGIIGAGLSGSSLAYFLRTLNPGKIFINTSESAFDVDVFEKNNQSGGRLALVNIDGHWYETGGSIIHPKNRYMEEFARLLGLKKNKHSGSDLFGIFDGNHLVFEESFFGHLFTALKLLFRYGLDPYRLRSRIQNLLYKFDNIYHLLNSSHRCFEFVNELVSNISFELYNDSTWTYRKNLLSQSFDVRFVEELVEAVIKVNYGQGLDVNGLTGSIAVAGAQSDLWSVHGGNRLVAQGLLEFSGATIHYNCKIFKITSNFNNTFDTYCRFPNQTEQLFKNYDAIVFATPKDHQHTVQTEGREIYWPDRPYHRIYVSFLYGKLKSQFSRLSQIFVCCGYQGINSIGRVRAVDLGMSRSETIKDTVWKVFSNRPLAIVDDPSLLTFFDYYEMKHQLDWFAYPEYENFSEYGQHTSFQLTDGIFYVNAIELVASAMEMSCIGARNVAFLLAKRFNISLHETEHDYKKTDL